MKPVIYLICGDDDYLVELKAKELLDKLIPVAEREWGLETIDGRADKVAEVVDAVDRCIESAQMGSMFCNAKLTWLRAATFLAGGGRTFESVEVKKAIERLTAMVKGGLPDGMRLMISAGNVPRNSALYKAVKAADGLTDLGEGVKPWERAQAAEGRVKQFLPEFELTMPQNVCEEFVARVGYDTRCILQELEKLRTYLGKPGAVTSRDVRDVVSLSNVAEANELTNAIGDRNMKEAIKVLHRLFEQNESAIKMVNMIERRISDLLMVLECLARKWLSAQAMSSGAIRADWSTQLSPEADALLSAIDPDPRTQNVWVTGRLVPQARNYTIRELRLARHLLIGLREKLVSSSLPEEFMVETTLMKILARPTVAAKPGAGGRSEN
jgi:DNA polymerase-3 subunit delta